MNSKFESVYKMIPLLSGFTILCGILRAEVYYDFFGIQILSYLDFSEGLLLFLDEFIFTFISFFSVGFAIYFAITNDLIKVKYPVWQIWFVLIGLIIFHVIVNIIEKSTKTGLELNIATYIATYVPLFLCVKLTLYLKKKNKLTHFNTLAYYYSGLTVLILVIFMAFRGFAAAADLKMNPNRKAICRVLLRNNQIIQTSDTLYYLGNTKNYIFFHNPLTELNRIIFMSEVSELQIKK